MRFTRRRPCDACPFRNDLGFPFFGRDEQGYERARELAESFQENHIFPCHKTAEWVEDEEGIVRQERTAKTVACAGMVLMAEGSEEHSNGLRIAGRLGLHDPELLDKSSPVYGNYDEFIRDHDPGAGPR